MAFIYFVRVVLELSKKSKIKNISLTARLYIALGYHLSRSRPPPTNFRSKDLLGGSSFLQ